MDAIERLRRRGRELRADAHRITSAPWSSAHCKQRAREIVDRLAQPPNVSLLVEHDREIQWPQTSLRSAVYNAQTPSFAAIETTDTLALFAWLHRDQLIAALDRLVDEESDDDASLTLEARQQQAAQVQGDLLDVERSEATLMLRGWADGLPIAPRPDIASAALLNVEIITPPALNGRGSSPERSGFDLVAGGRR